MDEKDVWGCATALERSHSKNQDQAQKNVQAGTSSERRNRSMNLFFENKVALVTGAGSGMGLATAQAFAAEGAAVALVDIDESAVRTATERLIAAGHQVIAIRCDVTDEAQVQAMIEQVVSAFGHLDVAFNNAGVQSLGVETADASSQEF